MSQPTRKDIPISDIKIDKKHSFRKGLLLTSSFLADVAANGILEPVLVWAHKGAYHLIDGERRIKGLSKKNKKASVPAIILTDPDLSGAQLILLKLMAKTSPRGEPFLVSEEGKAFFMITSEYDYSARNISRTMKDLHGVKITAPTILYKISLYTKASETLQDAVDHHNYPVTIATLLIKKYEDNFDNMDAAVNKTVNNAAARKALLAKLNGTARNYKSSITKVKKLAKNTGTSGESLDEVIAQLKDKGSLEIELAIEAGILKGKVIARGDERSEKYLV